VEGLKSLRLSSNGQRLNRIEKGVYQTLFGLILRSMDPNAS
jgi:hypothetical protein